MLGIFKTLKDSCTILLDQQLKIYSDHKNIRCKNFNIDRVLWWIIILEEYRPEIEYIPGYKNIVADSLSQLPIKENQETTHESTYKTETTSELYDTEELPDGMFPLSFNLKNRYYWEDFFLKEKLNCAKYKRVLFAEAGTLENL